MIALAVVLVTGAAGAAPTQREQVVSLVTEAEEHFEAGRFEQAIALLRSAYELEPNKTIVYNLGRALEAQGDLPEALKTYEQYLDNNDDARNRAAVEVRITTLRRLIDDREALDRDREAADSQRQVDKRSREDAEAPSLVPWIVAGLGGAMALVGVALGVHAQSLHEDAKNEPFARDVSDTNSKAKTFAVAANISMIAGGLVAAAGVTWGVIAWTSLGENTTTSALLLTGRF